MTPDKLLALAAVPEMPEIRRILIDHVSTTVMVMPVTIEQLVQNTNALNLALENCAAKNIMVGGDLLHDTLMERFSHAVRQLAGNAPLNRRRPEEPESYLRAPIFKKSGRKWVACPDNLAPVKAPTMELDAPPAAPTEAPPVPSFVAEIMARMAEQERLPQSPLVFTRAIISAMERLAVFGVKELVEVDEVDAQENFAAHISSLIAHMLDLAVTFKISPAMIEEHLRHVTDPSPHGCTTCDCAFT